MAIRFIFYVNPENSAAVRNLILELVEECASYYPCVYEVQPTSGCTQEIITRRSFEKNLQSQKVEYKYTLTQDAPVSILDYMRNNPLNNKLRFIIASSHNSEAIEELIRERLDLVTFTLRATDNMSVKSLKQTVLNHLSGEGCRKAYDPRPQRRVSIFSESRYNQEFDATLQSLKNHKTIPRFH